MYLQKKWDHLWPSVAVVPSTRQKPWTEYQGVLPQGKKATKLPLKCIMGRGSWLIQTKELGLGQLRMAQSVRIIVQTRKSFRPRCNRTTPVVPVPWRIGTRGRVQLFLTRSFLTWSFHLRCGAGVRATSHDTLGDTRALSRDPMTP